MCVNPSTYGRIFLCKCSLIATRKERRRPSVHVDTCDHVSRFITLPFSVPALCRLRLKLTRRDRRGESAAKLKIGLRGCSSVVSLPPPALSSTGKDPMVGNEKRCISTAEFEPFEKEVRRLSSTRRSSSECGVAYDDIGDELEGLFAVAVSPHVTSMGELTGFDDVWCILVGVSMGVDKPVGTLIARDNDGSDKGIDEDAWDMGACASTSVLTEFVR